MMRQLQAGLAVLALLVLAGCEGTWQRLESARVTGPENAFAIDLPVGWVRANQVADRVLVTRDGPGLEFISVQRLAKDKAFPKQKKSASEDLLPAELAELQIAELKTQSDQMAALNLIENAPAAIGGSPGFKLHIRFRNLRGLPIEQMLYGFADKKGYYLLVYQAPGLYYFDKYKADFENAVLSFKAT
jgi:hypothetical protein